MIWLSVVILTIVHMIPWARLRAAPVGLNPIKIIFIVSGVMTLPYSYILAFQPEISTNFTGKYDFEKLMLIFSFYYSLSLIFIIIGAKLGELRPIYRGGFLVNNRYTAAQIKKYAIIFFMIAVVIMLFRAQVHGGIYYRITNLGDRTGVLAGGAIWEVIVTPAAYISVFYFIYARFSGRRVSIFSLISIILILFFLMSLFGGRKAPMLLVVMSLIAYSVYSRKNNIFSLKYIAIYLLLAVFFVLILRIRMEFQSGSNADLDIFVNSIKNLSYLDTYLFILAHFEIAEYWYGVGYMDIFYKIAPNTISDLQPPMDDGVYVRSLAAGLNVTPPTNYDSMFQSSWPPETFGAGYMNFGFIGILLFSLIKGYISGMSLAWVRGSNYAPMALFTMIYIAFTFHFTNLRIVQLGMLFVGYALVLYVAKILNIVKLSR